MEISQNIKNQILEIIFQHIDKNSISVFLFGSYAADCASQASDIDIGFVCTDHISFDKILALKDDLNENVKTLKDIDFVDFNHNLDEEFKKIALKDVKLWHITPESLEILTSIRKHLIL